MNRFMVAVLLMSSTASYAQSTVYLQTSGPTGVCCTNNSCDDTTYADSAACTAVYGATWKEGGSCPSSCSTAPSDLDLAINFENCANITCNASSNYTTGEHEYPTSYTFSPGASSANTRPLADSTIQGSYAFGIDGTSQNYYFSSSGSLIDADQGCIFIAINNQSATIGNSMGILVDDAATLSHTGWRELDNASARFRCEGRDALVTFTAGTTQYLGGAWDDDCSGTGCFGGENNAKCAAYVGGSWVDSAGNTGPGTVVGGTVYLGSASGDQGDNDPLTLLDLVLISSDEQRCIVKSTGNAKDFYTCVITDGHDELGEAFYECLGETMP